MVLHASGTIFASQIRSEFNQNTSGTFFLGSSGRTLDSRLPQSGQISFSSFYNKYFRPATGNLRVWLDAKEYSGSGTTWSDLQGNANATLVNAPTFARPYFEFNGTSQYATLPDSTNNTDFTTSNNYTISCWVWVASTQNYTTTNDNDIIEKWAGAGGYPYVVRYDRPSVTTYSAAYNGGSSTGFANTSTIITNDWNHISVVFNWSELTQNIYLNGVLKQTMSLTGSFGTINNASLLYLMCRGGTGNFATGRLGMLMIHNAALAASEISRMYYATRNVFEIDSIELENGTWKVVYEYVNPKRNVSGLLTTSKQELGIYPSGNLTSDSTNITGQTYGNGTYISSASSVNDTNYEQAWRAFDGTALSQFGGQTFWRCLNNRYIASTGIYQGGITTTATNGITYSGEWLQIQLPVSIRLDRFAITPRQVANRADAQSPRSFVVLGSNDGSTWNFIHEETNVNNWTTTTKEWNTSGINISYSYYRLVIRRVGNYDSGSTLQLAVNIETWNLYDYSTVNRIGYFMQNNMGNGDTSYWILVTMDAYTTDLSQLIIPDEGNIFINQRNVSNLRIYSNHPQVGNYTVTNGRLEIWPSNYGPASNLGGGNGGTYDVDDTSSGGAGYGCVQVHDMTNTKTLLSWSDHRNGQPSCIGIGNNDTDNINYTASGGPDWTFADNGAFNWKFQVLIGSIQFEPTTLESGTWNLLYEINNPKRDSNGMLTYTKNNAALLGDRQFTKVGYYMQNNMGNGPTSYYAYVTMDAYTTSLRDLKIPDVVDVFINQRNVQNLTVYSNHPQLGNYSAANGRLEIWPWNYNQTSNLGGGSGGTYDYDDTVSTGSLGYGSVQIHDITNSRTILAWNRHKPSEANVDIGIGNNDATNIHYDSSGGPDWTFAENNAYNWKFQVYIKI